jgi:hypothetical protein
LLTSRGSMGSTASDLPDGRGDDVRALFGQPDRVTAALAAGGAGDEGDLACYSSCHGVSPFRELRQHFAAQAKVPIELR